MQSYIFDFKKSPSFVRKFNKEFDVEDIDTKCFYLVLLDDLCLDNLSDCLNSEGKLNFTDEQMQIHSQEKEVNLVYSESEDYVGIISLKEDTTFEFGDTNFRFKGAFLRTNSGYVLGGSVNTYSVNITNQMIFEKDLKFFEIVEGER